MKRTPSTPLLLAILLIVFSSCLKKDVDIDVIQNQCGTFKIDTATKNEVVDPSCTGAPLAAHCDIQFQFEGNLDCLAKIVIDPDTKIEDSLGLAISSMQFPMLFDIHDSLVKINYNSKIVSFRFDFLFPTAAAGMGFSDALVKFHCENGEGERTNSLQVIIYGNCSEPSVLGLPVTNVNLSTHNEIVDVKITLGDDDSDDYPSQPISVYLNGNWMLRDHLFRRAEHFDWTILPDSTNEMLVICTGNTRYFDNYCTVYFNGWHPVKCSLDPGHGQVIHIF